VSPNYQLELIDLVTRCNSFWSQRYNCVGL